MKTLRNIFAYLFAPYCLEIEEFNDLFLPPPDREINVAVLMKMPRRRRYRFFSRDDAYAFAEDWQGPSMIFRIHRRALFTDKA